jgi:hypothetical protein
LGAGRKARKGCGSVAMTLAVAPIEFLLEQTENSPRHP